MIANAKTSRAHRVPRPHISQLSIAAFMRLPAHLPRSSARRVRKTATRRTQTRMASGWFHQSRMFKSVPELRLLSSTPFVSTKGAVLLRSVSNRSSPGRGVVIRRSYRLVHKDPCWMARKCLKLQRRNTSLAMVRRLKSVNQRCVITTISCMICRPG